MLEPGLDAVLDRIAVLRGRPREVSALPGGLTNSNYKVRTPEGCYVVRRSPAGTDLLAIDRDDEYANSVAAASTGIGAPVIDYLPNEGVLVVGYIEGTTLGDADLQRPGMLARIARSCRTLHSGPRFVGDFDMFVLQRTYLRLVQARGFRLPPGYLDFESQVETLRRAMARVPVATVPCNNDLLAANFVDDGTVIRLIDYEYAGNNDPYFELGNIWSECHLDDDQLAELVTAYVGRRAPELVARAMLQGLMSRYGWTLWACIQQETSPLDFDFYGWGLEKYEAAVATLRGPRFDDLIQIMTAPTPLPTPLPTPPPTALPTPTPDTPARPPHPDDHEDERP